MAQSAELSNREWEVVNLLLDGKSNKLIASALHISESTVEFHLKNIYAKYLVSSRTELILKLRESTVAGKGEIAENRARPIFLNWYTTLREAVSKIGKEFNMQNVLNQNAHSEGNPMTFFESIRTCITKYAEFQGRASRSEFWWFTLFIILVASALEYASRDASAIFLIATLLPLLAAGTRRLRDCGKSGWWQLFLLAPVAGIVVVGYLWSLPPANPIPGDTPA
jgi:DNA-binding CsgD family transcriptional regulator